MSEWANAGVMPFVTDGVAICLSIHTGFLVITCYLTFLYQKTGTFSLLTLLGPKSSLPPAWVPGPSNLVHSLQGTLCPCLRKDQGRVPPTLPPPSLSSHPHLTCTHIPELRAGWEPCALLSEGDQGSHSLFIQTCLLR